MQLSTLGRSSFIALPIFVLLAGCGGGSQLPNGTPGTNASKAAAAGRRTFKFTGAKQTFKVPAGVTTITIDAIGAAGGVQSSAASEQPALGGRVSAEVPVTPGESLAVFVGGTPDSIAGGYNGGGGGEGSGSFAASAGGGATDVREGGTALTDRIIVAGGAGGQADDPPNYGHGGLGGGRTGGSGQIGINLGGTSKCENPEGYGGGGGTQHRGGSAGRVGKGHCRSRKGSPGTLGDGGAGGDTNYGGGGGGGGYYGGGGGAGGFFTESFGYATGGGGGGGGGSSYAEPTARHYHSWRGWRDANGNGQVTISW